MFCFSFSCADFIFLHGNFPLKNFYGNFSIEILLAKRTLLFWILLHHLLNMSSFCIGSISWCCLAVLLFCCSSHVPLFRGIPIIPPAFRCSVSVPVFRRCSASVPCSGVPGFIVCHKKTRAEHTTMLNRIQMSITFLNSICPVRTWFSYA